MNAKLHHNQQQNQITTNLLVNVKAVKARLHASDVKRDHNRCASLDINKKKEANTITMTALRTHRGRITHFLLGESNHTRAVVSSVIAAVARFA